MTHLEPRSELTACSQAWLSQVLLHATCYDILSKLPTLTSLEIFRGDFWLHVGKKNFFCKICPHFCKVGPPSLRYQSVGASHGGFLEIRHTGSPLSPSHPLFTLPTSSQSSSLTVAVCIQEAYESASPWSKGTAPNYFHQVESLNSHSFPSSFVQTWTTVSGVTPA